MAINPDDIVLSPSVKKEIAQIAEERACDWKELLEAFLMMARHGVGPERYAELKAQELSLAKIWDNEEDAIFDDL